MVNLKKYKFIHHIGGDIIITEAEDNPRYSMLDIYTYFFHQQSCSDLYYPGSIRIILIKIIFLIKYLLRYEEVIC